ncbi:MAG TPA: hypothetical protein VM347_25865 [Nonomuraea sp.]|nr:hypothetical protein [Nonomuraea sp.]
MNDRAISHRFDTPVEVTFPGGMSLRRRYPRPTGTLLPAGAGAAAPFADRSIDAVTDGLGWLLTVARTLGINHLHGLDAAVALGRTMYGVAGCARVHGVVLRPAGQDAVGRSGTART